MASALVLRMLPGDAPASAEAKREETDRLAGWIDRWNVKVQGWHLLEPHQMLVKYSGLLLQQDMAAGRLEPRKVLFPLCGADKSLGYLAHHGHSVVGVDGVGKAIDQLIREYGAELPASRDEDHAGAGSFVVRRARPTSEPDDATLAQAATLVAVQGDFLEFDAATASELGFGTFDAAFDRGSLVAISPADRLRYADVMSGLIRRDGRVLFVGVEHDCKQPKGPPFSIDGAEVCGCARRVDARVGPDRDAAFQRRVARRAEQNCPSASSQPASPSPTLSWQLERLYGGRFKIELLERSEERIGLASEARFRDRGATTFKTSAWLLTRL